MVMISQSEPRKRYLEVAGKRMAYVEEGAGAPIVFLHGNPTSSYLWRNVIPPLAARRRCIAPDLIGMGDSEKLSPSGPERYRFVEHRAFLDSFLETLGVTQDVVLVLHDWGSGLGFDWANRHRDAVTGIAYMEAIVRPLPSWDDWPQAAQKIFAAMRSDAGESLILEKNLFVERILPNSVLRRLSETEMDAYRRPFVHQGEDRRVMLTWPREIPIAGEPEDVVAIVEEYAAWMAANALPKLFVNAEPGSILTGPQREFCRTWKNQREVTVAGSHFVQEDSPLEIAEAIAAWLDAMPD